MRNNLYIAGLMLLVTTLFTSCEKEFDAPPTKTVAIGSVITIAQARALYVPGVTTRITEDLSVYGVVTADETTGNLYKESYIQDETGALYLRFNSSSGLYIGDSIRVNLKDAIVLKYNQMLQFDSLDADNSIMKIATQQFRTPELVSFADLFNNIEGYQGKLIQLDDVRFVERGLGLSYADGDNQVDESRFLEDDVSTIPLEVRTSGYSNFANDTLPSGSGSFIGICGQYNSDIQLLMRNPQELTMTGAIPDVIVKNFEDLSITSGGWTTQIAVGVANWNIGTIGGNYAQIQNFNGSANVASEAWMISPTIDLSASTLPTLQFQNAWKYSGAPLQLMITTNFTGDATTTVWTDITSSALWSAGNFVWANSGLIDVSAYLQPNVHIAFKYTGSNSDGSTWEIDDIKIKK
jgi:hypothetical protein